MMPKVNIKRLCAEDTALLEACAALEQVCIHEPWSLASFVSETEKPGGYVLAALDKHAQILGFVTASCVLDETEITNVAVSPAYRQQGIAGTLLQELFAMTGETDVYLEVRASNAPAMALYTKYGFVQVGMRKRFYRNPVEDAVLMYKANQKGNMP
ncbi:MAG: ribosomal protein S18-alanine N-acetyltransferase [Oscillospiraceae bacterium]|nr:ribosomal protein S18-alanine N-acetyltransferase [Oscillospiraceae bacterium]